MMIGAYGSILFTMTPEQKAVAIPAMPKDWWIYTTIWPFPVALAIVSAAAALVAGLVGIVLLRIGATAFGLTSFALLIVSRNVVLSSDAVTNGPRAVVGISPYTTLWVAAGWGIAAIVLGLWFKDSELGLKLRASREDSTAATSIGVNIVWVRWVAWTASGALTAIAGALWAHYVTNVSALDFWIPRAFLIISMLIVGGQTSVAGAVVGTVVITVASEGLRAVEYTTNILRVTNPIVGTLIPREVVGLTSFVLAAVLILILIRRPTGIMAGREMDWRWHLGRRSDAGGASPAPGMAHEALES
jgi:branched-chain amino acid transport system permease protein